MSHQIPTLSGIIESDTAATPNTAMERDPNGDAWAVNHRASGFLKAGGAIIAGISPAQTTGFTASNSYGTWLCDTSGGIFTATLPAAASSTGLQLTFVVSGTGTNQLTVKGSGSELINGANTYTSGLNAQYGKVTVRCDGTKWYVV